MLSGGEGGGHPKILALSAFFLLALASRVGRAQCRDGTWRIDIESSIPNDIIVNDIYINAFPGALINSRFHAFE